MDKEGMPTLPSGKGQAVEFCSSSFMTVWMLNESKTFLSSGSWFRGEVEPSLGTWRRASTTFAFVRRFRSCQRRFTSFILRWMPEAEQTRSVISNQILYFSRVVRQLPWRPNSASSCLVTSSKRMSSSASVNLCLRSRSLSRVMLSQICPNCGGESQVCLCIETVTKIVSLMPVFFDLVLGTDSLQAYTYAFS